MATLVSQTKKVLGFLTKIAQQVYDARLAHAEREVNRHRAFLKGKVNIATNDPMLWKAFAQLFMTEPARAGASHRDVDGLAPGDPGRRSIPKMLGVKNPRAQIPAFTDPLVEAMRRLAIDAAEHSAITKRPSAFGGNHATG